MSSFLEKSSFRENNFKNVKKEFWDHLRSSNGIYDSTSAQDLILARSLGAIVKESFGSSIIVHWESDIRSGNASCIID